MVTTHHVMYQKSLKILTWFLEGDRRLSKFAWHNRCAMIIQRRFRAQLEARHAKALLLVAYWDKLVHHITKTANKRRDYIVLGVIKKISEVKPKIKYEIMKRFVQSCR